MLGRYDPVFGFDDPLIRCPGESKMEFDYSASKKIAGLNLRNIKEGEFYENIEVILDAFGTVHGYFHTGFCYIC